jgi:hypothetical protein
MSPATMKNLIGKIRTCEYACLQSFGAKHNQKQVEKETELNYGQGRSNHNGGII